MSFPLLPIEGALGQRFTNLSDLEPRNDKDKTIQVINLDNIKHCL